MMMNATVYKQQPEDNQNWIVKGLIKLVGIKET